MMRLCFHVIIKIMLIQSGIVLNIIRKIGLKSENKLHSRIQFPFKIFFGPYKNFTRKKVTSHSSCYLYHGIVLLISTSNNFFIE